MSQTFANHSLMKRFSIFFTLLVLAANFALAAQAPGDEVVPTVKLEPISPEYKSRIGLSYLMGLNITVDFKRLGGLALSDPGSSTGAAVNRNYDNGYNRVDVSTNAGGLTWYWGYQNPNSAAGDNLSLQSYSTLPTAHANNQTDDPQNGVEVFYQRELFRDKRWRLGATAAFGYTYVSVQDSQTLKNTSYRTNDTYALGGVIPPLAPYNGTFQGPGALISSQPSSRSTDVLVSSATVAGYRSLDSDVFTIRLGPYCEVPVYKRLSLMLEGGLTLAIADTKFHYNETVTISDPSNDINLVSSKRRGTDSQTDFLVGAYAGGSLEFALTKQLSLIAGAHYQTTGQAINHLGKKESVLDFGSSIIVSVGAIYSF
jgi:hypothetical protein